MLHAPNHRYYRGCQGAWRAHLNLRVTDRRALHAALSRADAWSIRLMASWPARLGRFWLETSVDYRSGDVLHTTVIRWLGIPLMTSEERLLLHTDGLGFDLEGESRATMAPWRRLAMKGNGSVDSDGRHATYDFTWLGTTVHQTTVREDDRVIVTQKSSGFEAEHHLRRIGA